MNIRHILAIKLSAHERKGIDPENLQSFIIMRIADFLDSNLITGGYDYFDIEKCVPLNEETEKDVREAQKENLNAITERYTKLQYNLTSFSLDELLFLSEWDSYHLYRLARNLAGIYNEDTFYFNCTNNDTSFPEEYDNWYLVYIDLHVL